MEQDEITECISFEGDVLSYVPLKFPNNQQKKAVKDTGACTNAISEKDYENLKSTPGTTATISKPSENSKVDLGLGQVIPVRDQMHLEFSKEKIHFNEKFLALWNTNSIILGNPFFKNHSIVFYPRENVMKYYRLNTSVEQKIIANGKAWKTSIRYQKIGKSRHCPQPSNNTKKTSKRKTNSLLMYVVC